MHGILILQSTICNESILNPYFDVVPLENNLRIKSKSRRVTGSQVHL